MALNVHKIPGWLLSDLHERGLSNEATAGMTASRAFNEFCTWNGLIDWADTLEEALDVLRNAAEPVEPEETSG